MSKASRDKELTVVFLCKLYGRMLPVCRTTFTDIHCHIQYCSFHTTNYFTLSIWRSLEMKSSHNTIGGHTFVVLYKIDSMSQNGCYCFIKLDFILNNQNQLS